MAVHPSPLLVQAVGKVEQVVARLQEMQYTIAGLHVSPRSMQRTRYCHRDSITRMHKPSDFTPNRSCVSMERRGGWSHWSSPAKEVHEVVSEILMASKFAKEIATVLASSLQDTPDARPPVNIAQKPVMMGCKDARRKDTPYPSKALLSKTMSAKRIPEKAVNKFRESPAANANEAGNYGEARETNKRSYQSPLYKRRAIVNVVRASPAPNQITPRPKYRSPPGCSVISCSTDKRARSQHVLEKEQAVPKGSSAKIARAHEFTDKPVAPRRISMEATEIRSLRKPWRLTSANASKAVLFTNPVFTSSPSQSPAKPSRLASSAKTPKLKESTRRTKSWLTRRVSMVRPASGEITRKLLSTSLAPAKSLPSLISRLPSRGKRIARAVGNTPQTDSGPLVTKSHIKSGGPLPPPPARYAEVASLNRTTGNTLMPLKTKKNVGSAPVSDNVTQVRQGSRHLKLVDSNIKLGHYSERQHAKEIDSRVQSNLAPSCNSSVDVNVELGHAKAPAPFNAARESAGKENDHVSSCAPARMFRSGVGGVGLRQRSLASFKGEGAGAGETHEQTPGCTPAVMFLRSKSAGHDHLIATKSNTGLSILKRAKGWVSAQTNREKAGRGRDKTDGGTTARVVEREERRELVDVKYIRGRRLLRHTQVGSGVVEKPEGVDLAQLHLVEQVLITTRPEQQT